MDKLSFSQAKLPPSVNYHILQPCNYACEFCFVQHLSKMKLPRERAITLATHLGKDFEKVTFVGGEPTLCKWLPELIKAAKAEGTTTMLVTNGSRLSKAMLDDLAGHLDWLTISVDAVTPEVIEAIGRTGKPSKTPWEVLELVDYARNLGMRIKLNTVVCRPNIDEDLGGYVMAFQPERWKIFQALPIDGQNDKRFSEMEVSQDEFEAFVHRHMYLEASGIKVVPENNEEMTGSYAMVDPEGRFFDNVAGAYRYSRHILDHGVLGAFEDVSFSEETFAQRGGEYEW